MELTNTLLDVLVFLERVRANKHTNSGIDDMQSKICDSLRSAGKFTDSEIYNSVKWAVDHA